MTMDVKKGRPKNTDSVKPYNEEFKEEFLKQFDDNTAKSYRHAFVRMRDIEELKKKDVYEFTEEEVLEVFYEMNFITINSVNVLASMLKSYFDFSAPRIESNFGNVMKTLDRNILEQTIDKTKKIFLNEKEIEEIEDRLINPQDSIVVRLLFEGINGHQMSEMLNLTKNDIDWHSDEEYTNVKLKDDEYGERIAKISPRCQRMITSALEEPEYHFKNGEAGGYRSSGTLEDSDNVIKIIAKGNVSDKGADQFIIQRRLRMIKNEIFDLPYITAKRIVESGKIKMAKDLYIERGKLDNEELVMIAEQFGIRKINVGGTYNYNFHSMRQTINLENIRKLYPEVE